MLVNPFSYSGLLVVLTSFCFIVLLSLAKELGHTFHANTFISLHHSPLSHLLTRLKSGVYAHLMYKYPVNSVWSLLINCHNLRYMNSSISYGRHYSMKYMMRRWDEDGRPMHANQWHESTIEICYHTRCEAAMQYLGLVEDDGVRVVDYLCRAPERQRNKGCCISRRRLYEVGSQNILPFLNALQRVDKLSVRATHSFR
jgi:hypothetical protein